MLKCSCLKNLNVCLLNHYGFPGSFFHLTKVLNIFSHTCLRKPIYTHIPLFTLPCYRSINLSFVDCHCHVSCGVLCLCLCYNGKSSTVCNLQDLRWPSPLRLPYVLSSAPVCQHQRCLWRLLWLFTPTDVSLFNCQRADLCLNNLIWYQD